MNKREALETVERLYPQGWRLRELGELMGISHVAVRNYVLMVGVILRGKGRRREYGAE